MMWLPAVRKSQERIVTIMAMSFSRTAIIPVWLVVFGLFALFGSPMTFATGGVVLVGGIALTIMLVLWKGPSHDRGNDTPDPPLVTLPSADFVPNLWPDSGFRNSRQRGTRGR
jgi:hypothetical protein